LLIIAPDARPEAQIKKEFSEIADSAKPHKLFSAQILGIFTEYKVAV